MKLHSGDIICFKGEGIIFKTLSFLLGIFDRQWHELKWKPWHMAIAYHNGKWGWKVIESTGRGVEVNYLLSEDYRVYTWLDKPPSRKKMEKFVTEHLGKNYDVGCYLLTMLQYLVLHFFNHRLPRILDDQYTCWELVFEFCREMGKPIQSLHNYPIIIDFLKAVENETTCERRTSSKA